MNDGYDFGKLVNKLILNIFSFSYLEIFHDYHQVEINQKKCFRSSCFFYRVSTSRQSLNFGTRQNDVYKFVFRH